MAGGVNGNVLVNAAVLCQAIEAALAFGEDGVVVFNDEVWALRVAKCNLQVFAHAFEFDGVGGLAVFAGILKLVARISLRFDNHRLSFDALNLGNVDRFTALCGARVDEDVELFARCGHDVFLIERFTSAARGTYCLA